MAKQNHKKQNKNEESLEAGIAYLNGNALFHMLNKDLNTGDRNKLGKNSYACVYSDGRIYLNKDVYLEPREWAYVIAHCMLHLAFGHFDAEHMPGYFVERQDGSRSWKVSAAKASGILRVIFILLNFCMTSNSASQSMRIPSCTFRLH